MTLMQIISLAVIAGLLELDNVVFLQAALSRPLVTSVVAGLVLGDVAAGATVGALIELIFLGVLPMGALVPPSFSLAGIFAAATAIALDPMSVGFDEAATGAAMLAAGPVAYMGGWFESKTRRWLGRVARGVEQRVAAGDENALGCGLATGVALTWLRAFLAALISLALILPLVKALYSTLPPEVLRGLAWFYWMALMLGLVVVLDLFWEQRYLRVFNICLVVACVLIYGFGVSPMVLLPLAALVALALWKVGPGSKEAEGAEESR